MAKKLSKRLQREETESSIDQEMDYEKQHLSANEV